MWYFIFRCGRQRAPVSGVKMNTLTSVGAIKRFFSSVGTSGNPEDYKKVELAELNKLTGQEREELGILCAKALGMQIGQELPA
jgi:hypothetical protein